MSTRILVVDDAATVRMFFRAILSGPGREIVEARDGVEALELASAEPCDLAFVDINMPGLDGYEVVRRLRARPISERLPVVMCSTESKPIDELSAYRAGANFYVRKPAPPEVIKGLVSVLARGEG